MNILIVEDEVAMADSLKIGLENKGYRAVKAYNGQQALELITHGGQEIHLVVTDYLMPIMDGLELMKVLRRKIPTLPVIIMTASAEKSLIIETMKSHCSGLIVKPFSLDQLVEEIERIKSCLFSDCASDNLSRLLPKIVHQINNPLTAIRGYVDLIQLNRDKKELVQCYAEKIISALNLISGINKDIINGRLVKEDAFTPIELNPIHCQSPSREDVLSEQTQSRNAFQNGPDHK